MPANKVLIVEDQPSVLMAAARALRASGLQVIEARTADAAAIILEGAADEVAVVFSDIRTPGRLSGGDLAQLVADRWPSIAVVLCSGQAVPPASELTRCVRFVRKPYDLNDLSEMIADLMRR